MLYFEKSSDATKYLNSLVETKKFEFASNIPELRRQHVFTGIGFDDCILLNSDLFLYKYHTFIPSLSSLIGKTNSNRVRQVIQKSRSVGMTTMNSVFKTDNPVFIRCGRFNKETLEIIEWNLELPEEVIFNLDLAL